MNNREMIQAKVESIDYIMGGYDVAIDRLPKAQLDIILEAVYFGTSTDVAVMYRKKKYVVEIAVVDNEMDFSMMTLDRYLNLYGEEYADKFE